MKVTVHIVVQAGDDADAPSVVREVLSLDRDTLAPDTLGLQRGEAMDLLSAVQGVLVDEQAKTALATQVACPEYGRPSPQEHGGADVGLAVGGEDIGLEVVR
ncbi:MAG: hypothetical protein WCF33_15785 [Pseudonocardiaceae bacterium]